LSSGSQQQRTQLLGELAQELRQLNGLSASFFRAAAARMGVTVTDMQVVESLASTGPMTAGQLAELTGLTTGAITGMLNRLEEAGLVQRERDPNDARRVIVRLATDNDQVRGLGSILDLVAKAWEQETARLGDEQIALIVEFLKRSNALARQEIRWLREAPEGKEGAYSAPLENVASGQLTVSGAAQLTVRASNVTSELYQARFEGTLPEVKAKDGVVAIRYPRRLWVLTAGQHSSAEVTLNAGIPWWITIKGGAAVVTAELGGLDLVGLEVKGGMSKVLLKLPVPSGVIPIRISGGASDIAVRRPAGVSARVHLKGWVSHFVFDEQTFSGLGSDVLLENPGYQAAASCYDIEVASSASMVSITAG